MTSVGSRDRSGRIIHTRISVAVSSTSQVSRLPACQQSSPSPTHHKGRPAVLHMSTPNPYSHPSFFPTHAIVREKLHPVYRSHLTHCLTFIVGTSSSSPLTLLPLVGPCVRGHRSGHGGRTVHEPPRSPQGQISSVDART